jgi:hypothetical protein
VRSGKSFSNIFDSPRPPSGGRPLPEQAYPTTLMAMILEAAVAFRLHVTKMNPGHYDAAAAKRQFQVHVDHAQQMFDRMGGQSERTQQNATLVLPSVALKVLYWFLLLLQRSPFLICPITRRRCCWTPIMGSLGRQLFTRTTVTRMTILAIVPTMVDGISPFPGPCVARGHGISRHPYLHLTSDGIISKTTGQNAAVQRDQPTNSKSTSVECIHSATSSVALLSSALTWIFSVAWACSTAYESREEAKASGLRCRRCRCCRRCSGLRHAAEASAPLS